MLGSRHHLAEVRAAGRACAAASKHHQSLVCPPVQSTNLSTNPATPILAAVPCTPSSCPFLLLLPPFHFAHLFRVHSPLPYTALLPAPFAGGLPAL